MDEFNFKIYLAHLSVAEVKLYVQCTQNCLFTDYFGIMTKKERIEQINGGQRSHIEYLINLRYLCIFILLHSVVFSIARIFFLNQ